MTATFTMLDMEMQQQEYSLPQQSGGRLCARERTGARHGRPLGRRLQHHSPGRGAARGTPPRPRRRMKSQTEIRLKLLAALVALGCGIGAIVTSTCSTRRPRPRRPCRRRARPPLPRRPCAGTLSVYTSSFPTPPAGRARARAARIATWRSGWPCRAARVDSRCRPRSSARTSPLRGLSVSFDPGAGRRAGRAARAATARVDRAGRAPRVVGSRSAGRTVAASAVAFALPASRAGPVGDGARPAGRHDLARAEDARQPRPPLVRSRARRSTRSGTSRRRTGYTYEIRNGPAAVSIGTRRWDRLPGQRLAGVRSRTRSGSRIPLWQWRVERPPPRARRRCADGRSCEASFFDPQLHAWFTIEVEQGDDAYPGAADDAQRRTSCTRSTGRSTARSGSSRRRRRPREAAPARRRPAARGRRCAASRARTATRPATSCSPTRSSTPTTRTRPRQPREAEADRGRREQARLHGSASR